MVLTLPTTLLLLSNLSGTIQTDLALSRLGLLLLGLRLSLLLCCCLRRLLGRSCLDLTLGRVEVVGGGREDSTWAVELEDWWMVEGDVPDYMQQLTK